MLAPGEVPEQHDLTNRENFALEQEDIKTTVSYATRSNGRVFWCLNLTSFGRP